MAEYSTDGLWDSEGFPLNFSDIKISEGLLVRLKYWTRWYEYNDDYLDESDRSTPVFDKNSFVAMGYDLAVALKFELHDYTVEYFDELTLETTVIQI